MKQNKRSLIKVKSVKYDKNFKATFTFWAAPNNMKMICEETKCRQQCLECKVCRAK